jgi:methyl-accepting chemotaxis protein
MSIQLRRRLLRLVRVVHFPAMWVISQLRYGSKFSIIAIVLLLPPLLVAWQQYTAATHQMRFNQGEHLGTLYIQPLQDLLDAQERHWVASVARSLGHKEVASIEAAAAARAGDMLAQLDALDAKHRDDALFELFVPDGARLVHARLQDVKHEWMKALEITKHGSPVEIDAAHESAMATTSDFVVAFVANYSNLILDPDLDSYWLMDIAVVKAPKIGISYARATASALLGVSGDRVDWIVGMIGSLTDARLGIELIERTNLPTSIKHTKDYGQNHKIAPLVKPFSELKAAAAQLAQLVERDYVRPLVVPPAAVAEPSFAPLVDDALVVFSMLDTFYGDTMVPLRELTARRADQYRNERLRGVLFTLLAVLLHFYVFAAFYFNIRDSIHALTDATARMVSGTTETFHTKSRDEISDVVDDFNTINVALVEARALQRRVHEEHEQTTTNIVQMLQVVSEASKGNLTVRAPKSPGSLGSLAEAFNELMVSLERLVGEVSEQIAQSENAVLSIAQVARTMASGATSQTNEVQIASKLVDDVARQIAQVSSTAEEASAAAVRTASTAEHGEQAVENVIQGMATLRTNVQSGAKKMKNLGDRSMEITSIVGTISRISEQTNMLALNAAIEAARAGDHGRGFSVVADEVRKLAERASEATKDIEKLVKAITTETNETIKAIEVQTHAVEDQSRTVAAAGESLGEIRTASDRSAGLVAGITTIAKQQVEHARRVTKTMEAVTSIAIDTRRGVETTVDTINDLVKLSNELRRSIGRFRVTGVS